MLPATPCKFSFSRPFIQIHCDTLLSLFSWCSGTSGRSGARKGLLPAGDPETGAAAEEPAEAAAWLWAQKPGGNGRKLSSLPEDRDFTVVIINAVPGVTQHNNRATLKLILWYWEFWAAEIRVCVGHGDPSCHLIFTLIMQDEKWVFLQFTGDVNVVFSLLTKNFWRYNLGSYTTK